MFYPPFANAPHQLLTQFRGSPHSGLQSSLWSDLRYVSGFMSYYCLPRLFGSIYDCHQRVSGPSWTHSCLTLCICSLCRPGTLLPHSLIFPESLSKYHLLGEVFLDHPIQNWPAPPLLNIPHFYFSLYHLLPYKHTKYLFCLLFVSPD